MAYAQLQFTNIRGGVLAMKGEGQIIFDDSLSDHTCSLLVEAINRMDEVRPIEQSIRFENCTGMSRNGYCRQQSPNSYLIRINKTLINDSDITETTIHELLHSYPDIFPDGHGPLWKALGRQITQRYGIRVTTTAHREKALVKLPQPNPQRHYIFHCPSCNRQWFYQRRPKWYMPSTHAVNGVCPHCNVKVVADGK